MDLKGKVAIVTGGSTGIGRQICLTLASKGASIVINYNSGVEKAEKLANEIRNQNGQAEYIQASVDSYEESEKLIKFAIEKFSKLDILVNNAGVVADALMLRMSEEDFDKVIKVNLKGTWNCCKHAVKYMMKQRSGKIVNIASVVGIIGNAGQTNYAASKAGIIALTKSIAREVSKRGINVNAVAPGFIKTKMTESLNEQVIEEYIKSIPIPRLGEPQDVANLVAFLTSDLSNYITGQVINVDGGLVMC
ncbi:MAG: 3-oxoacyl-[acyl-carrier-protein] reductase [Clostridia bacterium]|jgi:3-oxoacyl-[acyl-carrier protein] reductase|nr:3-oxoacyl-[acyl-carrier-protein] reductase [Clostridia bacterium]MDD3231889.1 3-oxoacyl-[acyl-carrier-protein] reductase [Clostridia bacterium]MDD3862333.1 3-oxoacyl-[acyl-carrier-protein] reductase [Clostridia bacterium]